MRKAWAWVWLLLASPAAAGELPETPPFRHVGVAEGLPSSRTTGVALDRDGFLWIATRDGLVRYDGVGYTVYRYEPGDSAALPGNAVRAVFIDAQDRVWASVEGRGLAVLDADRRGFRRFDRGRQPILRSNEFSAIAQTPDGAVWAASLGGGVYRFDRRGRILRFVHEPRREGSLPSDTVRALARDAQGRLWAGTQAGLAQWTGRGWRRVAAHALPGPVLSLSAESDGSLWIGAETGLLRMEADESVVRPDFAGPIDAPITAVRRDSKGTRWIATTRGLWSERGGRLHDLRDASAAGGRIAQIVEDAEGGLWMAGSGGVLNLPSGWRQFAVFGAPRLGDEAVQGMAPAVHGGAWLVGRDGAVDRLDVGTGAIHHAFDLGGVLPGAQLRAVHEQADGTLWLGHSHGLSRRDPAGRFQHWPVASTAQEQGGVLDIVESSDGLLWISLAGTGIETRNRAGVLVHRFSPGDGRGVDCAEQDQLSIGPDGAAWLAGPSGLRRWNGELERFVAIPGAPRDRIFGFAWVPPDTLWLHRLDQLEGYRWDGHALARFRVLGGDAGLPAMESGGVMADRSGVLWLTTVRGLWRYDPVGDRLRRYGVPDGLPDQEFLLRAPLMLPEGLGLAATDRHLVLFDPARMHGTLEAPRLTFDAITLRRDEDLVPLHPNDGVITMQPGDRDLHVGARLQSLADPGTHSYRFLLHGYDADWVVVGPQGERTFSSLEPGDYRLEVGASRAEGRWTPPLTVQLHVLAPWWQQRGAQVAAAVLLVGVLLALARQYRRRLRRRHARQLQDQQRQLKDQGSEAKTRFLAMLGHEIRTPMTGVLGMAELLQRSELSTRQRQQVDSIQRAGEHLLHLVNDALDLARIESGKLVLDEKVFDLHALLDEASHLLQALAAPKGLHFSLQRAPGTPRALRGDPVRLRQILLNLGSNAVKFTDYGEVALRSAATPQGLLLEISDTGPGMDAAQVARLFQRFEQGENLQGAKRRAGSGLGLAICQELAHAMGGSIDVQSQPGQGTCLRVRLPLPVAEPDELLPEKARRPPRSAHALRVLVVEDDPTVATVVTGLLDCLGHVAVHAEQGLAALTELAAARFDLALLDLDLPGLDGFDLARIIRSQGHVIALVALTARSDPQAESLALAAGMDGFLRKPVTSQLLQEKIEAVLAAYRAQISGPQPAMA